MKKIINCNKISSPVGPYSHAILSNGFLYISGQIGINKDGKLICDSIDNETYQVMDNINYILQSAKMTFNNVIKMNIYLINMDNFYIVNNIYKKYFNIAEYPARETLQVVSLPLHANIEISTIASV